MARDLSDRAEQWRAREQGGSCLSGWGRGGMKLRVPERILQVKSEPPAITGKQIRGRGRAD